MNRVGEICFADGLVILVNEMYRKQSWWGGYMGYVSGLLTVYGNLGNA